MKEFDFIRQIKKQFPNPWENSIGNDCGVFSIQGNGLITKDLLVEGTHFYHEIPMKALAYKALAVNMSDIYADGGIPQFFVIGVGAGKKDLEKVKELYSYFYQYCSQWNIPIIGGDTVSSPVFFLSVTCVGKTENPPWLRKNAREGNFIYVTGTLGSSAYGLAKIKKKGHDLADEHIYRHLFPPLCQNASLGLQGRVNAAADVSDGFLQDLSRILEESGVGAEIELNQIPYAQGLPKDEKEALALYGGEDYELILITEEKINEVELMNRWQISVSCVGKVTGKKDFIELIDEKKNRKMIDIKNIRGFNHWQ